MKKTKPQSTEPCFYCKEQGIKHRAEWRTGGLSLLRFSCQQHVPELKKFEDSTRDDGHMSEADYQTWGRYC